MQGRENERSDVTKHDLRALNEELIEMLIALRDQIDDKLDEIAAVAEEDEGSEDED